MSPVIELHISIICLLRKHAHEPIYRTVFGSGFDDSDLTTILENRNIGCGGSLWK
ncbi:6472_t:CDS:2 [Diversispora eburnea]|uniref:6472_t:CDS:1 n=1 Tax=Diversispora eburnea TaxID=1213867 RepID=A0A9N9FWY5_9GLOM|nr:6472_t:CDS:2 [Diversispora eburnea]